VGKLLVEGETKLAGKVRVSGAKNAALAIMAATVLVDGKAVLESIPDIEDVRVFIEILRQMGMEVSQNERGYLIFDGSLLKGWEASYELAKRLRASNLLLGPLLSRCGKAEISMPGGCNIGTRPIDLHIKGLEAMGARIKVEHGIIYAEAKKMKGAHIYLDFPSVGATENIMTAASLAEGTTVIENAAKEPEIVDLASFLSSLGVRVRGAGTDVIKIEGVKRISGCQHAIIPDRIEAGTFMVAAALNNSDLFIENVIPEHLEPVTAKLREMGVSVEIYEDTIHVTGKEFYKPVDIKTYPYPGFPTDMQSQFIVLLTQANGDSVVIENVFENRLKVAAELKRMGANIKVEGRAAIITGNQRLSGAPVRATDLRSGAALILAGLAAKGTTEVFGLRHIDRGYEHIEDKLNALGAKIVRVEEEVS
jgi:UDP-N-acetylglucosamine 1-carboxyvinyltransferase